MALCLKQAISANVFSAAALLAGPAVAVCDAETAAYQQAKSIIADEVKEIYRFEPRMNLDDLKDKRHQAFPMRKDDSQFDTLEGLSQKSRRVHFELDYVLGVIVDNANGIIRKRRPLPAMIPAGAKLSNCYATLERAETLRLKSLIEKQSSKNQAASLDLSGLDKDPEMAANADELRSAADKLYDKAAEMPPSEEALETAQAGAVLEAGAALADTAATLDANPEIVEKVAADIGSVVSIAFPLMMIIGGTDKERTDLSARLERDFDKKLEFGEWLADEVNK